MVTGRFFMNEMFFFIDMDVFSYCYLWSSLIFCGFLVIINYVYDTTQVEKLK